MSSSTSVSIVTFLVLLLGVADGFRIEVPTEPENTLTCYTCPRMTTNKECNKWAPDIYCPQGHTVCRNVHKLDIITGESLTVHKRCVKPEKCSPEKIGCFPTDIPEIMECVSCCGESYCNVQVPTNDSTALELSAMAAIAPTDSAVSHDLSWPIIVLALVTCLI